MSNCALFTTHSQRSVVMEPSTFLQHLLHLFFLIGGSQAAYAVLIDSANFAAGNNDLDNNEDMAGVSDAFIRSEISASLASSFIPTEELEIWEDNDDDSETTEVKTETTFTGPQPTPGPVVSDPLDTLVDFALEAFDYIMTANHTTKMKVPDFHKDFRTKIGFLKVHGHITATGGEVGDLSSLFRDGKVTVRPLAPNKLVLEGAAGLRYLRATFSRYSARAGPVRVSGTIQATMSPATVRCVVELSPPCHLDLRTLTIGRLGPLNLRVSGLGVLRSLMPFLRRWIEKRMRADAEVFLQGHLAQMIREQLRQFSCGL